MRSTLFFLIVILIFSHFALYGEEICGKWDYLSVNNGEYMAQNNIWGASTAQCIDVNGTSFRVTRAEHNLGTSGSPASYPSLFKGCHWEDCTTDSGMPIQVTAIQTATIEWSNTLISSGAWNVTTEAWFKRNATPGDPDGAELMIWINHSGSVQPGGSRVGTANIGGRTWDVWYSQIDWNFITYKLTSPTTSINLDYKPFIDDAISRGYVQSSWYMMDIEAGFEIWQGGTGLSCDNFTASVNGSSTVTNPPQQTDPPQQTNPPQQNLGDVNNDGSINIVDALMVAQYYVGSNPSNFDYSRADTNCDNNVNIVDALIIAQYYVGLVDRFC
ncbi:MAG: hypothetical protein JW881_06025 [Spirochaetales bacterium]|nr:hypothetical protein [Spirochaetales bacterium]